MDDNSFKTAEAFDRAILTLASAALSLSLLFIDKVIDLQNAHLLRLLFFSWGGFLAAIACNLLNLFITFFEINRVKALAKSYYSSGNEPAGKKLNNFKSKTIYLNVLSGASYLSSMILLVVFMVLNIRNS